MRVTEQSLDRLNARLDRATPLEILTFVEGAFGDRAAILSGMQRAGTALCHMADRAGIGLDVLFVDTGVLHAETYATRDALAASSPKLRVITLSPAQTMAAQVAERGVLYLTKEGQEQCCELRKSAPLLGVRGRYDALVSALRKDEGGSRAAVRPVSLDVAMNALRVHPFAGLDRESLDAYLAAHPDVVVNPLHAMGFPTIGCFPCTTPVLPDEPERAGRWRHLASVTYCGINPIDRAEEAPSIDLDDRYAEILG